jgi:HAD superfamily hydrolase (TIGR01456 family)
MTRVKNEPIKTPQMLVKTFRHFSTKKHTNAVLLDIDGVIWKSHQVIPSSKLAIQKLQQHNIPFLFLTNAGGEIERDRAELMSKVLDTRIDTSQIILSHTPMQELAARHAENRVLVVGAKNVHAIAREYGFKKSISIDDYSKENPYLFPMKKHKKWDQYATAKKPEKVSAILVMNDPDHVGQDLQIVIDLLRSNGIPGELSVGSQDVELYMSAADFLYSTDFVWPRFGAGLFKQCLTAVFKELTGKDVIIHQCGKPEINSFKYAERRIHQVANSMGHDDLQHIYMVGDNPAADIRGANRMKGKFKSVLVRTGV